MAQERLQVPMGDGSTVSAVKTAPDSTPVRSLFIYAPGAGSNLNDPFGAYLDRRLPEAGVSIVRFQFPYMEAAKRRPDSRAVLEETWRRVIGMFSNIGAPLIAGGRSMGGRIASQVVAQGAKADAVALFAYPLHAPGTPSKPGGKWRDEHLPGLSVPTLFCSGTRDAFATPSELAQAASLVSNPTVHLLEGAGHGFATLKSSGRTKEDVWSEAAGRFLDWLEVCFSAR
ncbi:MAG: dienelactone hydrolase family protein [Chloroflexi bacterium]|nr:dienelactone hydrolase family protein [Chloroflexota bacterium]